MYNLLSCAAHLKKKILTRTKENNTNLTGTLVFGVSKNLRNAQTQQL
jgi:hypothetical protein